MPRLFVILLSFLTIIPNTTHTDIPYGTILPVSAVLAVVGGFTTKYCYDKQYELVEQLDELKTKLQELDDMEMNDEALAEQIATLEQRLSRFNRGKWLCGGLTLASIIASIFCGIQWSRQKKQSEPEKLQPQKEKIQEKPTEQQQLNDIVKEKDEL